jgi:hypothetical protein
MKSKPHDLTKAQERSQRYETREAIKQKRALLRDVAKHRKIVLADVRRAIKQSRADTRRKLAHWKEINRQILTRAIEAERHEAKAAAVEKVHGTSGRAGELARAALAAVEADLKHLRWLGHRKFHAKSSARVKAATLAAERRSESDEFVKRELAPEFHAAWEENKHTIKAKKNASRWEVAQEWMHDHSAQVAEANRRQQARDLNATIATEREYYEDKAKEKARERAAKLKKRVKAKSIDARRKKLRRGRSASVPF